MKYVILVLALAFSFNSMAGEAKVLKTINGRSSNGEDCSFTVIKKDDWEGQIVYFFNGKKGNFRVELVPETRIPLYENVSMTFSKSSLTFNIPAEEPRVPDTIITLKYKKGDHSSLISATADGIAETYNCTF